MMGHKQQLREELLSAITHFERETELIKEILDARADYLEMMTAAYFKVTDIDPREAELVEEHRDNAIVFYFRKKPEQE